MTRLSAYYGYLSLHRLMGLSFVAKRHVQTKTEMIRNVLSKILSYRLLG